MLPKIIRYVCILRGLPWLFPSVAFSSWLLSVLRLHFIGYKKCDLPTRAALYLLFPFGCICFLPMALPAAIAITISIMAAISWESFPRRFLIAFVAVSVAGGVRIMRAHHATRPASRSLQLCCGVQSQSYSHSKLQSELLLLLLLMC